VRITEDDLPKTVRLWLDLLAGLPEDAIRAAAQRHMRTEKQFPRIAEMRTAALEYLGRTNAVLDIRWANDDLDVCGICGARYEVREIERNKVVVMRTAHGERFVDTFNPDGSPDLTGKGEKIRERVMSPRAEIFHDRAKHGLDRTRPVDDERERRAPRADLHLIDR
jgi:hypothetical protein